MSNVQATNQMRQFLSGTPAKTPEAVLADAPFHAF